MFNTQSTRWRLNLWLGLLLVALLSIFGVSMYQIQKSERIQELDRVLSQRASSLGVGIRGGPDLVEPPPRPPEFSSRSDRPPPVDPFDPRFRPDTPPPASGLGGPPPGPEDARVPGTDFSRGESIRVVYAIPEQDGFYDVIWIGSSGDVRRRGEASFEVPMPEREGRDTQMRFRTRDGMREAYHFTERGDCALAGAALAPVFADMLGYALKLLLFGTAILGVGLGGSWWLTNREIRPIEQIADTAQRIANGMLSERIQVERPKSEFGRLVAVLNATFERLQAGILQQKRFTSDASHELRTPLSVLITETQVTLSRSRSEAEYRDALQGNLDTARQMKRLAEELLELARLDGEDGAETGELFDVSVVVKDRVARLKTLADRKGIEIVEKLAPVERVGSVDRLGLVMTNLIENAIHYGHERGRIEVECGQNSGSVFLRVTDNGPGISEEDQTHIFERFYRSDKARSESGGRYGLGLAICKRVVELDGGTIEVESSVGCGATFWIRFKETA